MAHLLVEEEDCCPRPVDPAVPEACPRCGADFDGECNLREVNLTLSTGDREWDEVGWECACCGWCTEATPGVVH
jgi:hypothetical protein